MGDLTYWWQAYFYNLSTFMVLLYWVPSVLILLTIFFSMKRQSFRVSLRKKWIFGFMVVFTSAIPLTDRYLEEVAFRKACAEEAGLYVYQQIVLAPEYWVEIDPEVGPVNQELLWIFEDIGYEINANLFRSTYKFVLTGEMSGGDTGLAGSKIVEINSGTIFSEMKNFLGGPSGFLSQRNRTCEDLPKYKNLENLLSVDNLFRNTVVAESLNGVKQ